MLTLFPKGLPYFGEKHALHSGNLEMVHVISKQMSEVSLCTNTLQLLCDYCVTDPDYPGDNKTALICYILCNGVFLEQGHECCLYNHILKSFEFCLERCLSSRVN